VVLCENRGKGRRVYRKEGRKIHLKRSLTREAWLRGKCSPEGEEENSGRLLTLKKEGAKKKRKQPIRIGG